LATASRLTSSSSMSVAHGENNMEMETEMENANMAELIEQATRRVLGAFGHKVKGLLPEIVDPPDGMDVHMEGVLIRPGTEVPFVVISGVPADTLITLQTIFNSDVKLNIKAACAAMSYAAMYNAMLRCHGPLVPCAPGAPAPPSKDPMAFEIASVYFQEISNYIFHSREFTKAERDAIQMYTV